MIWVEFLSCREAAEIKHDQYVDQDKEALHDQNLQVDLLLDLKGTN